MTFAFIILASFISSAFSFVGAIFLVRSDLFTKNRMTSLVSFAAGVMLATSFFDMLPEAAKEGDPKSIFTAIFLGIVTFFFLERFVLWFHHHDDHHEKKASVWLVLIGDGFHNMLDGVAIAASFVISPLLGLTTTVAICTHEIPHELGDFSVLVEGGLSKMKALVYNFISGLTALAGAVGGYFFLERVQHVTWIFLAFSAGMFIYIACSDLIPELHEDFAIRRKWTQTIPFVAGAAILWIMVRVLEG